MIGGMEEATVVGPGMATVEEEGAVGEEIVVGDILWREVKRSTFER